MLPLKSVFQYDQTTERHSAEVLNHSSRVRSSTEYFKLCLLQVPFAVELTSVYLSEARVESPVQLQPLKVRCLPVGTPYRLSVLSGI